MNEGGRLLDLADWRRRVQWLYADVRSLRQHDPAEAHRRWRAGRDALLGGHPQSPLPPEERARFNGAPYHPYAAEWAVTAPVDTVVSGQRYEVGASDGRSMTMILLGRAVLPFGALDVFWIDDYGGGLFVPFRDATAGADSYGGGRYLLDTAKGADLGVTDDGALVLDFNFAYHPSCRYSPQWSCPLAPPGNQVEVAIRAGERMG